MMVTMRWGWWRGQCDDGDDSDDSGNSCHSLTPFSSTCHFCSAHGFWSLNICLRVSGMTQKKNQYIQILTTYYY